MPNIAIVSNRPSEHRPLLLLVVPSVLLLLLLLLYPVGPDQSIYMIGGRMLVKGGVYYRDILDVKPPPVHWLAAAAMQLFGQGIEALRLADLILQSLTVILLAFYLRACDRSDAAIMFATSFYALGYLALGTEGTFQPEGWAGLLLISALLLRRMASPISGLSIGMIGAVLFAMKFTLVLPLFAFLLIPHTTSSEEAAPITSGHGVEGHHPLHILAGFAVGLTIFFGIIHVSGGTDGLRTTMSFLSGRQAWTIAHGSPIEQIVRGSISYVLTVLGPIPTLLSSVAFIAVIRRLVIRRRSDRAHPTDPVDHDALLVSLVALMLLFSALSELMVLPYQLGRLLLPVTILTLWGIDSVVDRMNVRWTPRRLNSLVMPLMIAAIVLGPLPRVVNEVVDAVEAGRLSSGLTHPLLLNDRAQREEYAGVVSYLNRRGSPDDGVAFLSGYTGYLALLLSSEPPAGLLHGHQLIARFSPASWRERFLTMIEEKQPLFLIVDRNDSVAASFVGGDASIEWLRRALHAEGLDLLYHVGYRSAMFVVLERSVGAVDTIR